MGTGLLTVSLRPEEPPAGPWRVERIDHVIARFAERAGGDGVGRPLIVAIDGRSASGKTTVAERIAGAIPATTVVHTDDIAWFHSPFGWVDLAQNVLEAARSGRPLSFRPPAWEERGREGAIVVPAGRRLVLLEGVGASREELAHLLDGRVWIQADRALTERRDEQRVQTGVVSREVVESWMAEELPFLAARRPWERADLVVSGMPSLPHDPLIEIVVAYGPLEG